jgi:phenylpropionate dioxygenase-like ring-hydroxylating dioxygenase large terminal subunit
MDALERSGSGTVLSDIGELVQEDRLHRSIYTKPEIFRLEMRNIFGRTWVYVGHESEIANTGDYKATYIGLQPMILTRDENGKIQVLVNRCPHRGSVVCRQEKGNSNFFRCPYHGWTYKNTGELIGVPRRNRYPEDFDIKGLSLVHVPRVESYRGLIFASFNPDIEGIEDYLAQAKPYVDAYLDLSIEGEIALTAGSNKHEYPGNWKFQMENGVDGYHAMFLHDSFFKIQARSEDRVHARIATREEAKGWTEAFDNGHAILAREAGDKTIGSMREAFPEYFGRLEQKHGPERFRELLAQMNIFIFPNLYLLLNQVRVIQPVNPTKTLVTMYPTMLKGAPDALNEQRLREHEEGFAASGFVGPDDYEAFVCVQEGLKAESVEWLVLLRGIHDEKILENGAHWGQPSDETPQRGQYREWKRLLTMNGGAK